MTQKFTVLLATGAALFFAPLASSQAQHNGRGGPAIRGYNGGGARYGHGGGYANHRGGRWGASYGGRHRYYHRGSYFYYDPFLFGGFGYPSYYYGGFGPGIGVGYSGYGDGAYGDRVYQGRIASGASAPDRDEDEGDSRESGGRYSPNAMARAVQSELKDRGYYRGAVDGQFGSGTASALRSFQRDKGLKATGRIDERTLKALGFDER